MTLSAGAEGRSGEAQRLGPATRGTYALPDTLVVFVIRGPGL